MSYLPSIFFSIDYLGNLDIALLLDVEEGDSVGVVEREHPGGTRVRHLVAVGGWKLLSHCVLQVLRKDFIKCI